MNIFSYIKSRISILDVISQYATLKKAGLYFKGICPFHSEKTPSFTVSPGREIFYCFGCHESGDLFTFISKVEHCSLLQAAQQVAERFSITIPDELLHQQQEWAKSGEEKDHYERICKIVATWAHTIISNNQEALQYLKHRNINVQSIKNYTIGYFPSGLKAIKNLIEYAKKENLLIQDLLNANIIAQGKTVLYSPYEDRIIFPIKDSMGRFCGFGGRTFKSHDQRAKYYNSKENPNFIKGSLLFNLDAAKKSMQKEDSVFLVEGYTDCIAMTQAGYTNTVATLGTACTLEHLKQLSRYVTNLIIVYDADSAGQKAIMRMAHMCWQTNLEFKIIQLPKGTDPSSYLHEHTTLEPLINSAQDIFSAIISTTGKDFDDKNMGQKVAAAREIISLIAKLDDPLKKEILLKNASDAFNMSISTLNQELQRQNSTSSTMQPKNMNSSSDKKTQSKSFLNEISTLEKKLFCAMINPKVTLNDDVAYLLDYFSPPLRELLQKYKELSSKHGVIETAQFFDVLSEHQKKLVSQLLIHHPDTLENNSFDELLIQFQKKHWKSYVFDVKQRITQAKSEHNHEEVTTILLRFQELKKKLMDKGLI